MGERVSSGGRRSGRPSLNRGRIVEAATHLADREGLASVTMRAVASSLGVEAMSLYNHVTNRADLLDAMVDAVFATIELSDSGDWQRDLRQKAESTRATLLRHSWAIGMLDSCGMPGDATLRHLNHIVGVLRRSGFSSTMSIHVLALVDSYVYGSVIQELSLPLDGSRHQGEAADRLLTDLPPDTYPHLVEVARDRVDLGQSAPSLDDEFDFGLSVIIGALGRQEAPASDDGTTEGAVVTGRMPGPS